jgi:ATP-dependent Zn protease
MLKDLRYSIAVHESGHALVGLTCGLKIRGMHIDPEDKGSATNLRPEDFGRLTLDDQVTVTLAGAEAVEIVGCEHMSGQALEDHALVRAMLLRRGIDENTAEGKARGESIRKNARAWAQVILAPRRELITRLATALSEAGKLDEGQIAALLAS